MNDGLASTRAFTVPDGANKFQVWIYAFYPLRTTTRGVSLAAMAYQSSRASHLRSCVLMLVVVLLILAVPFACMSGGAYTETFPRPFDSERWKAADVSGGSEARCAMLADLRVRIGVLGRTKADLSQLLGEPQDDPWEPQSSYWLLCNSLIDVWVLRVDWQDGRASAVIVHDT